GQEALAAQHDAEHLGEGGVVVDDQDTGSHDVQYSIFSPPGGNRRAGKDRVGAAGVAPDDYRVRHRGVAEGGSVETSRPRGVMPLRPLPFGELPDGAVSLLRTRANVFLSVSFVLAALEQAWLYPLRQLAGTSPPSYLPYADLLGAYWLVFAFGMGTEALVLA